MLNKKALASTASAAPLFVDELFSTYLYTGNGSTQTITNNIDLSGKGGLVWCKSRSGAFDHGLCDTNRGTLKTLFSNSTGAQETFSTVFAYNNNGFSVSSDSIVNENSQTYASWTFRKAPKFFDVVTYTGNGVAGRTVAHNLGSTPGMVIVKNTSNTSNWFVWHRSLASSSQQIRLNTTEAANFTDDNLVVTSSNLEVYTTANTNGQTYVAYLFAHNAGGFGTAGTDNIISCGSFTTDGSGNATVDLGYEPQYLLIKQTNLSSAWYVQDVMRGMSNTNLAFVTANTSDAESNLSNQYVVPTATGFNIRNNIFGTNGTFIYMAIRRPMKVPTTGTSVFAVNTWSQSGGL